MFNSDHLTPWVIGALTSLAHWLYGIAHQRGVFRWVDGLIYIFIGLILGYIGAKIAQAAGYPQWDIIAASMAAASPRLFFDRLEDILIKAVERRAGK